MTAATWITMVAVLGFVWGGFVVALRMAMRSESVKGASDPVPPTEA